MTAIVDQPEQSEQPELRESIGKNGSKNGKKEDKGRDIFLERWFHILATALMSILILACCAVPIVLCIAAFLGSSSESGGSQAAPQMTMLGAVVAMLGILMATIFVFMTIRIDRGAKAEARRVSEVAMKRVARHAKKRIKRSEECAKRSTKKRVKNVRCKLDEKVRGLFLDLKGDADSKALKETGGAEKAAYQIVSELIGALDLDQKEPDRKA